MTRSLLIILLLSSLCISTYASIRIDSTSKNLVEPNLKVLLAKGQKKVLVTGNDLSRTLHTKHLSNTFPGKKTIEFNCVIPHKVAKGKPVLLASLDSRSGFINWDKEKYQGQLHILANINNEGCDVINEIPLEDYISTVLPKEMNSRWPIEALKAQAVAARSYAIQRIKNQFNSKALGFDHYYDLENSEVHQVSGNYSDATYKTKDAANSTRGEVLVDSNGRDVPVFFHAKCGGKTLTPDQVWENKVDGYESVVCPHCNNHGEKGWNTVLSYKQIDEFLKWANKKYALENYGEIGVDRTILLAPDRVENFKLRIYVGEKVYILSKPLLRKFFGRNLFPANRFTMERSDRNVVVKGVGLGHGVGMCQLGALAMAQKGYSYQEILKFYFPNFKIKKVY